LNNYNENLSNEIIKCGITTNNYNNIISNYKNKHYLKYNDIEYIIVIINIVDECVYYNIINDYIKYYIKINYVNNSTIYNYYQNDYYCISIQKKEENILFNLTNINDIKEY